jgi:hypothetical protein
VTVDRYRGQRETPWVFSHTALSHTPGLPPVAIRLLPVCEPVGMIQLEAFFSTDLQASLAQILAKAVRAGRSGSLVRRVESSSGRKLSADGRTRRLLAPRCPVLARHPPGPAIEPTWSDPGASDGLVA